MRMTANYLATPSMHYIALRFAQCVHVVLGLSAIFGNQNISELQRRLNYVLDADYTYYTLSKYIQGAADIAEYTVKVPCFYYLQVLCVRLAKAYLASEAN